MSIGIPPPEHPLAELSWPSVVWRIVKGTVVFLIVAFHLIVLLIRNPLDLWDKEMRDWLRNKPDWGGALAAVGDEELTPPEKSLWDRHGDRYKKADKFTFTFTNTTGIEQRWVMFGPPLARKVDFLAMRIEFADGKHHLMLSDNEPADPTSYFRLGGWQVRKLETYLTWPGDEVFTDSGPEKRLWEAYVRHRIGVWKERNPGDPRVIERVTLVRRRLFFPTPNPEIDELREPAELDIASFTVDGKVIR